MSISARAHIQPAAVEGPVSTARAEISSLRVLIIDAHPREGSLTGDIAAA